jgi:hypothetical protein
MKWGRKGERGRKDSEGSDAVGRREWEREEKRGAAFAAATPFHFCVVCPREIERRCRAEVEKQKKTN